MHLTLSLAALAATTVSALPQVTIQGNAFWSEGERFYVRGVAYQPGGAADAADPLLDIPSLTRDIANFKKLGINTIRVYTIDNTKNHDVGMRMLDEAGIYLALDANTPDFSLNRADVWLSYNERYLQSIFATIDKFHNYNNTLLFFSGNEVINNRRTSDTAPYIKAVTRDMKSYIANRGYRAIPVAYAAADVSENIEQQLAYFDCGDDIVRTDAFAVNDYSWCDPSSFTLSGWDVKVEKYSSYGAPLFLAEFGCNTNTRKWGEIASIYNPRQMTPVFSGGLAYEYTLEENGYGLVTINSNGQITPNADFQRLADAFAATPNPSGNAGARLTTTASRCPASSQDWAVANLTLPAPPAGIQEFMRNGAGQGPGLSKNIDPSHYGGETYSESWVSMGASQPSRAPSSGGSGSSGSGSGGAGGSGAAGALTVGAGWVVAVGAVAAGVLLL